MAHAKGLYKIARKNGQFDTQQISKEGMFRLYQGKNKDLYASIIAKGFFQIRSDNIIQHFNLDKYNWGKIPLGSPIYDFAEDISGKMWIAAEGELNRYDPISKKFLYYNQIHNRTSQEIELYKVWDTHIDHQDNMWLASKNGLFFLSKEEMQKDFGISLDFKTYYYDKDDAFSISSNVTTCLLETRNGTIWVGTESGFNRFDEGRFIRYLEEETNNFIMSILEDKLGNLWLGTNNGLVHFNTTTETLKTYTTEDGLMSNTFTWRTAFQEEDGLMVFVAKGGIISFYPDSLSSNTIIPPVYMTDFKLFNKSVKIGERNSLLKQPIHLTQHINLNYQQNVLTFQFAALNFFNSDANEYAYQLVGFDDTLQYIGARREATFTNLNPGDYTLWVQASNNDGVWNKTGAKLNITIFPPWWKTWWAYGCWSILFLGILYSLYQFQLSRQLARLEANRLKELDVFKTNLYTNITHEFRTPLTIILGMAKQIRDNPSKQLEKGLNMIQRNGQDLLNLVNQMLSLSKLESGNLEVQQVQGNFITYIQYLVESFQSLAASKSIALHFITKKESLVMAYDAEKIKSILSNLLSNAIKFTPENGQIDVEIHSIGSDKINLSVRDTGQGIQKNKINHIFQRFYQIDDSSTRTGEGTGIGLALTKGLVELLGGKIEVNSQIGVGTIFIVTLPRPQITTALMPHSGIVSKHYPPAATVPKAMISTATTNADLPMVLIVEDHEDVVSYLSTCLEGKYDIKVARNGQEGIDKALALIPDLIISDLMMPEKDGFELCEHLKTDTRSSHIPIILLTAKADIQSRIAGLRFGADDYLAKPFHEEELAIRVENLLKIREQLRTYYTSPDFLTPQKDNKATPSVAFSVQEEAFLKQVIAHIEKLIDQPDLTAEKLADLMFMSYANLYRKLKALTGMNVGEYIRHIRLQKAAALLKSSPDLSISQITLEVGFVTLAHFSREFKKVYGLSPSKFRKA